MERNLLTNRGPWQLTQSSFKISRLGASLLKQTEKILCPLAAPDRAFDSLSQLLKRIFPRHTTPPGLRGPASSERASGTRNRAAHFSAMGKTEARATSRRMSRPEAGLATRPTDISLVATFRIEALPSRFRFRCLVNSALAQDSVGLPSPPSPATPAPSRSHRLAMAEPSEPLDHSSLRSIVGGGIRQPRVCTRL